MGGSCGDGWGSRGHKVYRSLVFQGRVRYPKRPVLGFMGEPCKLLKHKAHASPGRTKGPTKQRLVAIFKVPIRKPKITTWLEPLHPPRMNHTL